MDIINLLKESIDDQAIIKDWNDEAKRKFSIQLAGSFDFKLITLLGIQFLLLTPMDNSLPTDRYKRQMKKIEEISGYQTALWLESVSAYRKKKYLKSRISFLNAEGEIYLPFVALRMKAGKPDVVIKQEYETSFTPSTQLIFLYLLYHQADEVTMEELAGILGLSIMTVQRGLTSLQSMNMLKYKISGKTGRKKLFCRIDQDDFFRIGKTCLINPVKREVYVRKVPENMPLLKSALTALSEQTMLAEPEMKTFAVSGKMYDKLNEKNIISREMSQEIPAARIQIMKYNVVAVAHGDYVDPVTLIASLTEHDERIEMAIDELMEDEGWYQG